MHELITIDTGTPGSVGRGRRRPAMMASWHKAIMVIRGSISRGRHAGRRAGGPASYITTRMQATHHATKGPEFLGPRAEGPQGRERGGEGGSCPACNNIT